MGSVDKWGDMRDREILLKICQCSTMQNGLIFKINIFNTVRLNLQKYNAKIILNTKE